MAKHTPGPWTLLIARARIEVRTSPEACYAFSLSDEANARLIAAAPELLEALKGLLGDLGWEMFLGDHYECIHCGRTYDLDDCPDNCDDDCPGEIARAAIAKAEGRV